MIEIDGSFGEGGGAILRQALGLSAFAGRPIRVRKIRAGRENPGLAAQHLSAVKAAAAVCGARTRGASRGSPDLVFEPGAVRSGALRLDVGTAGATTLVLQTVLLPCLLSDDEFEFEVTGGTDVPWSPPADYLVHVTLETLAGYGQAEVDVETRGYYPRGGGRLRARLSGRSRPPGPLKAVRPGRVRAIRGVSHADERLSERRVAERQAEAAGEVLAAGLECSVDIRVEYSRAASPGSGVTVWTESDGPSLGGSALGARGKPAERVGREAAEALLGEIKSGAAVDRYLADQLVPFLAACGGMLTAPVLSAHVHSNIYVAERILGARFEVEAGRISVREPRTTMENDRR